MNWLDRWQRNHLVATPIGVFACSLVLWIIQGYSVTEALGSSLVQFGVLLYGVLVSLSEIGGGMFYAMAIARKWRREQHAKTERDFAEATTKAIDQAVADDRAQLLSAATPKEAKLLKQLMKLVDRPTD